MSQLVPPHNSEQVNPLLLPETERAEERKRAEKLRKIPLDSRAVFDIFMLAMGAYTPLDGFMRHDDWRGSCLDMKRDPHLFAGLEQRAVIHFSDGDDVLAPGQTDTRAVKLDGTRAPVPVTLPDRVARTFLEL
jgi:PUA-like domain